MTRDPAAAKDWLKGAMTALVTPFDGDKVDVAAFETLVKRQLDGGTHGLIPVGTTGEGSTLTIDEHIQTITACARIVDGAVPVIAGVGSNDTPVSIALAKAAEEAGADAVLAATGYYNRPSQAGLVAHYTALADAISIPVVLYNVPGRTACDIAVETIAQLAKHPRIVGLKDATANLARVARQRLACPPGFVQLSGEDLTAVGFNAMGGRGCISVTGNVVPDLCSQMQTACLEGRWEDALLLQDRLAPLHDALFADTSPSPVKYALSRLGLMKPDVRLPLVEPHEEAKRAVDGALAGLGLL